MAAYDFECQSCGERFEVSWPISQHDQLRDKPPECPKCGKRETRQLASMFSCKAPSAF